MPIYTVHVPPGAMDDTVRADGTVFTREGFAWGAFLLGPLALLYRGLWLATLLWVLAGAALFAVSVAFGLGALPRFLLYAVLAALTGCEAAEARGRALGRAGFIPTGLVAGRTRDEAEERYFAGADPLRHPVPDRREGRRGGSRPVIGLFPPTGGRA